MARELSQILTELNAVYNPQKDVYNAQMASLPEQQRAEEAGLEATKRNAFQDITDQSNRRGLFYSGIPIAEEQKYTGASYLPAVANLKGRYAQQRFNLQDALAKISASQYSNANDIYQKELDRDAAERAARASGGGGTPSFGFGGLGGALGGGGSAAARGAQAAQRGDGGFNFTDAAGRPISAASYAAATGKPFTEVLKMMANAGDAGARSALGFVGNDYGYDPSKVNNQNLANLYNQLVWGTGRSASVYNAPYNAPQAQNGRPGWVAPLQPIAKR